MCGTRHSVKNVTLLNVDDVEGYIDNTLTARSPRPWPCFTNRCSFVITEITLYAVQYRYWWLLVMCKGAVRQFSQ